LREKERGGSAGKKVLGEKLKAMSLMQVMNFSINQTLGRTIITSLTVIMVCVCLWLLGNASISELAFTLLVGVVVGTYSTMFIACPAILALSKRDKK
jgi:preprotein translocase subunit SecF